MKSLKLLATAMVAAFCFAATSCEVFNELFEPIESTGSTSIGGSVSESSNADSSSESTSDSSDSGSNEKSKYTVTFDVEGVDSQTIEEGNVATEPTEPAKQGYVFDGWLLDGAVFDFETPITGNVSLVAKWKPATDTVYTVEVYVEQSDGTFEKYAAEDWAEEKKGTTDSKIDATNPLQLQQWGCDLSHFVGMQYNFDKEGTIAKGTVAADGSLVIKIYLEFISYEVTYTAENATLSSASEEVSMGDTATAPTVTPNAGYEFKGWYNGDVEYDFNTAVSANLDLVAKVEPIVYTITYNLTDENGLAGTAHSNVETYTIETESIILADATSELYAFCGWYNANGEQVTAIEQGTTGNIELQAKWRVIDWSVVDFEDVKPTNWGLVMGWNGWETFAIENGAMKYQKSGDYSSMGIQLPTEWLNLLDPAKHMVTFDLLVPAGKTFNFRFQTNSSFTTDGATWMQVDNNVVGTGEYITFELLAGDFLQTFKNNGGILFVYLEVAGDNPLNIYDVCYIDNFRIVERPCTVTYAAENATISSSSEVVMMGSTATAPTVTPNAGYEFKGWYNGDVEYDFNTAVSANLDLVAKVEPIVYTITYNLTDENGLAGTAHNNVETYTIETESIILADATSELYGFCGWYNANGEQVTVIEQGTTGNIELRAKWKVVDWSVVDFEDVKPTNWGLVMGWNGWETFAIENGAMKYQKSGDYSSMGIQLPAQWVNLLDPAKHKVTFDLLVPAGKTFNFRFQTNSDYTTNGAAWMQVDNDVVGTGEYVTYELLSGDFLQTLKNNGGILHVYLETAGGNPLNINDVCYLDNIRIVEIPYTVTYTAENATLSSSSEEVAVGGTATAPTVTPNAGYEFKGWYNGDAEYDFSAAVNANLNLVAKVEPIIYTITYNLQDRENGLVGTAHNNVEVFTIESNITLAKATSDIYGFCGWYNANGEQVTAIEPGTTGNIELWAKWKVVDWSVIDFEDVQPELGKVMGWNDWDVMTIENGALKYQKAGAYSTIGFKLPTRFMEQLDATKHYITFDLLVPAGKIFNTRIKSNSSFTDGGEWLHADNGVVGTGEYVTFMITGVDRVLNTEGYIIFLLEGAGDNPVNIYDVCYIDNFRIVERPYTVTYTAENATLSSSSEEVAVGGTATAPTVTPNAGYEFKGWYNGDAEYDFSAAVNANLNLVAKVEPIIYTITYNLQDRENGLVGTAHDNVETYTIETETFALLNATSDIYGFCGWYNANGEQVTAIEQGTTGNIELWAKWKEIDWSVIDFEDVQPELGKVMGWNDWDVMTIENGALKYQKAGDYSTIGFKLPTRFMEQLDATKHYITFDLLVPAGKIFNTRIKSNSSFTDGGEWLHADNGVVGTGEYVTFMITGVDRVLNTEGYIIFLLEGAGDNPVNIYDVCYIDNFRIIDIPVDPIDYSVVDFEDVQPINWGLVMGWNGWETFAIENGAMKYQKSGDYSSMGIQLPTEWLNLLDPAKHKVTFDLLVPAGKTFNIRFQTNSSFTTDGAAWMQVDNNVVGTGEYVTFELLAGDFLQTFKNNGGILFVYLEAAGDNPLNINDVCYLDNIRIVEI